MKTSKTTTACAHAGNSFQEPLVQTVSEPTPELRQKLNRLFDEVSNTEGAVSVLIERVQPITKPLPPRDPCCNKLQDGMPQAEISNDVERLAERLSALVYRVTEIIDNLAL